MHCSCFGTMFHQEYHTLCLGDEMPEISFHSEASLQGDDFGNTDCLFKHWPLCDTLDEVLDRDHSDTSQARDTIEQQQALQKDKISEKIESNQRKGISESYAKEKSLLECRTEFVCPICKKIFTSFARLFNHMQLHGGKLQCSICHKGFASRSHLRIHIQRHMKIRTHYCQECSFSSTDKHDLAVHIRRHKNERKFQCEDCDKKFFRKVELNYHRKCVHLRNNIKQCKLCTFSTHSQNILNHHNINKHQIRKAFCCHKCRAVLQHKHSFIIHMRRHTGLKPFSCIKCKKLFKSKSALTSHFESHKVASHSCTICKKKFSRKSNLLQHKIIHTKKKTHLCTLCSYSSFWKSTLVRHLKTVHKTAISTGEKLNNALNTTVLENRQSHSFIEMSAPEKEAEKSAFDRGRELQVAKENFCFSEVNRECNTQSKLHHKIHSCPECFKVFKRISELRSHLFVHKKNSFECDVCNKKFKTKSNLNRHITGHTGLKPYSCSFCSYASNLKTSLTRHVSSKHGSQT